MKKHGFRRIIALLLTAALLFTSCRPLKDMAADGKKAEGGSWKDTVMNLVKTKGEKQKATTISLTKTEGTVNITTDKGKTVPTAEGLKLYDGYSMSTRTVSYAWINLDRVKLAKMDETSEIDIQKKNKDLEIYIRSGALFFNVAEPLKEDETMNIRTSSTMVGIRGTCGWVNTEENSTQVYLLEGRVSVSIPDTEKEVFVSAGEMAEISTAENGESNITVKEFSAADIPRFILTELDEDEELTQAVLDASSLDIHNPSNEFTEKDALSILEKYREIILQADSYTYTDSYAPPIEFHWEPTGTYWYSLVKMKPESAVPTLFLKQDEVNGVSGIRAFHYYQDIKDVVMLPGILAEGRELDGDTHLDLLLAEDGNGILWETWAFLNDERARTEVYRLTLGREGYVLDIEELWIGGTDVVPEQYLSGLDRLEWHSIDDTSALDNWTPGS